MHLPRISQIKPTGSRAEQQICKALVRSDLALQDGSYGRLANALDSANVNVAGAYILNWMPEQAGDIYAVLVSENRSCDW